MRLLTVALLLAAIPASAQTMSVRPRVRMLSRPKPQGELRLVTQRILYMNRNGGHYTYVSEDMADSSQNISNLLYQSSADVPRSRLDDNEWQQLMACVTEKYERFDIQVTDVDPGAVPHIESVIAGGTAADLGWPADEAYGTLGVSPFDFNNCAIWDRSIVMTWADLHQGGVTDICYTVAQEVAHSFGLDHEYLCADPMTYLENCGDKQFQDFNAMCGEYETRPCTCSATQNSVQMLGGILGIADTVAPTLAVTAPLEGAMVPPGFVVLADARDENYVKRVELWVDGSKLETDLEAPYELATSPTLALGSHVLEVRAIDRGWHETKVTVNVTVGAECSPEGGCDEGEVCVEGRCALPLDASCTLAFDCASGVCSERDGDKVCVQLCSPDDAASCPAGYRCDDAGDVPLCAASSGGGGCDVGGGGARDLPLLATALLLGALLLVVRRSRA